MKKIIVLAFALVLILSLTACAAPTPAPAPTPEPAPTTPEPATPGADNGALKDGTYEGKGDKWQYGDENATVVIAEGKIAQVTLRRLTTEGQEVDYEEWTGVEVGGKVQPNLKQFREDLAQAIIAKQSTEVDDIAGATVSSKNWKVAVERALEQAKVK
ncbi:MAG: hypothetical protein A2Y23_12150 [Clostridiales bacterium GWB2_37_7]|nr:MAG: hypothetical protein A2Y23_12150 [Clostridiales bacterium GWB2_37_7]